jgi:hypothetical protein
MRLQQRILSDAVVDARSACIGIVIAFVGLQLQQRAVVMRQAASAKSMQHD